MDKKTEQSTEEAIMEAAKELFLKKGFAGTSTVAIARQAGCNQSLVHYYYRSKKNLFGLVFKTHANLLLSSLTQISQEDLPFEEKMKKRISAHFDFIQQNRRLPVMFFNEIATNNELVKEIFETFSKEKYPLFHQFQADLDVEYQQGNIRKMDAFNLIFSIFSLNVMTFMMFPMLQLITQSSDDEKQALLEKRKTENIELIMNSIRPLAVGK